MEFSHGEHFPATTTTIPGGSVPGQLPPHTPGQRSVVYDGLGGYECQDYVAARPSASGGPAFIPSTYDGFPNPGNVLANVLTILNRGEYGGSHLLDRIRLVQFDHSPVAEFVRDAGSNEWRLL